MRLIINIIVSALAVFLTAYLIPDVVVDGFWTYFIVAIVLGAVNAVIGTILKILTFPLTLVTFGLFALVINALMVMLTSAIVPGFNDGGFLNAFIFAIVLSIISWFLKKLS